MFVFRMLICVVASAYAIRHLKSPADQAVGGPYCIRSIHGTYLRNAHPYGDTKVDMALRCTTPCERWTIEKLPEHALVAIKSHCTELPHTLHADQDGSVSVMRWGSHWAPFKNDDGSYSCLTWNNMLSANENSVEAKRDILEEWTHFWLEPVYGNE
ncbi:hypothetical protein PMAYCL1PPCAC_26536 [Pristionchus mayeri]|uniref:Secreted protein n=1 Tax=Pristionchus mayeri TaxID=1317129 RepID=A0AAN5IAZ6_9BILA|nr:hypothetical protein PMAYCL1PPCAC_26536 [Pristionchus mayeri]